MFKTDDIYSIYVRNDVANPLESTIVVKDGFSFIAFLLSIFWALYHRVWGLAALCFFVMAIIGLVEQQGLLTREMADILTLAFSVWVGFEANDWRAASLENKGYVLLDVVSARNEYEAQKRFFDNASVQPVI